MTKTIIVIGPSHNHHALKALIHEEKLDAEIITIDEAQKRGLLPKGEMPELHGLTHHEAFSELNKLVTVKEGEDLSRKLMVTGKPANLRHNQKYRSTKPGHNHRSFNQRKRGM